MQITDEELQRLIADASKEGAKAAIREMKKKDMFKNGMTAFQKTEYLLKNYKEFKNAILERNEQIKEIESLGARKKSSSITSYPGGTRSEVTDEYEKADLQIMALKEQNEKTEKLIKRIDNILEDLKNEPYFEVLSKYYFEGKKFEVIAGELCVSTGTVSIARKKFIDKIKIKLFVDDVVKEIFG